MMSRLRIPSRKRATVPARSFMAANCRLIPSANPIPCHPGVCTVGSSGHAGANLRGYVGGIRTYDRPFDTGDRNPVRDDLDGVFAGLGGIAILRRKIQGRNLA